MKIEQVYNFVNTATKEILGETALVSQDLSNIVVRAVFAKGDRLPPTQITDRRIAFIYAILRRIRRAALAAGVSHDMFALGIALSLMMSFRMAFRHNRFYAAANGMLKATSQIIDVLSCRRVMDMHGIGVM